MGLLDIQWNIEPDRPGATAHGFGECLGQHDLHILLRTHDLRVLAHRAGHGDGRPLLVTQLAQARHILERHTGLALDLAGQHDHGNGVGERPMHPVERVDRARAGRQHHHGRLAGDARITLGGHGTSLLMVHERAAQLLMATQGLVEEHGTAAGDGENLFNPLLNQPLRNLLRYSRHHHSPRPRISSFSAGVSL